MNMKFFTSVKMLICILVVVSCFLAIYMVFLKSSEFHFSDYKNFKNLQLKKMDKLLSTDEQSALIRLIVKESLQEIAMQNQSKNISFTATKSMEAESKLNSNYLQRLFHQVSYRHQNHSIRNKQLQAFQVQMTIEERTMMYSLIETFDGILKKHNITYFMYGGTLLGSFRHHDLIPWDDDLDVILSVSYHKKMPDIFKSLSPEFILYRAGGHDKFYHKSAKKASGYNWLWPYLDISYYEENSTYITDWTKTYGTWYSFPKSIIFPLHNRPLLNLSLPAPKDTFAFLTWTYKYGSKCIMYGYSHMVEGGGPSGSTDCETLNDKFPFVEHLPDSNGVREILKYRELEITNLVLPEPRYAVSETFQLSLKSGYKMPSDITPPP